MIKAIGIPLLDDSKTIDARNDALMRAAALYHVPVYIYRLPDISTYIAQGTIPAMYWDNGEYRECVTDLPKYTEIYCAVDGLYQKFPKEFEWLLQNTVFTDFVGMGKYELHQRLLFSNLSQYAIPTFAIHSYEELLSTAPMFPSSILKPMHGRRSAGVMKLESRNGEIFFSIPEASGILTREFFTAFYIKEEFGEKAVMLLEPCLNILNDEGRAVDFRCLVSLNGEGRWQNVITYGRIGGNGVASNISCGGTYNTALDVLEELVPGQGREKLKEMNSAALQIAEFVQHSMKSPVSWLGLDLCMERPSNQIYVIEANSKPATKLTGRWELSMIRAQYFTHLLKQAESER